MAITDKRKKFMGFMFWNGFHKPAIPTVEPGTFDRNAILRVEAPDGQTAAEEIYRQAFPMECPDFAVQVCISEDRSGPLHLPMAMRVYAVQSRSVTAQIGRFTLRITGLPGYREPTAISEAMRNLEVILFTRFQRNRFRFVIRNHHITPLLAWFRLHADEWDSMDAACTAIGSWWQSQRPKAPSVPKDWRLTSEV